MILPEMIGLTIAVHDGRNVQGPYSIAVPGYLAGIASALQRFGTRSLTELAAPAVASANQGMDVDWFATLADPEA